MKKNIKNQIQADKENIMNAKLFGQIKADELFENLIGYFLHESENYMDTTIAKITYDLIRNPDELIEEAFDRSFKSLNYINAFKYVCNLNKYCIEVGEQITSEKIKCAFLNENNQLELKFNSFQKLFQSFFTKYNQIDRKEYQYNVYFFFDEIAAYLDKKKFSGDCVRQAMKSIMDANINNIDDFIQSFQTEFSLLLSKNSTAYIEEHKKNLQIKFIRNFKYILNQSFGCKAMCPGCGTKCYKHSDHEGGHASKKHLFTAFLGWNKRFTKEAVLEICWKKTFFEEKILYKKNLDQSFHGFKNLLLEMHPDWYNDIYVNYIKFGENSNLSKN